MFKLFSLYKLNMSDKVVIVKGILNTIIRLVPVSLYAGTIVAGLIFQDFRGILLFLGFFLNEMICLGYMLQSKGEMNPNCALMRTEKSSFALPSTVTQTVGFFTGFTIMKIYEEGDFTGNLLVFISLIILLLASLYSVVNIGCLDVLSGMFSICIGILLGVSYYYIVKDYYTRDYLNIEASSKDTNEAASSFFKL